MNAAKIFFLVCVLDCASLTISAAASPNPLVDLPDAIFNRPRFAGGGGGFYGGMHLNRFAIVRNIIYVADGPMGLAIYNVKDPARPRQVGAYPTDTSAFAVHVTGSHASVITSSGMLTFDVSDPTNPKPMNLLSNVQDRIEKETSGRLVDVKVSHSDKAEPEANRPSSQ